MPDLPESIDALKQQIRQLEALQASGALTGEAARSARAALDKRLLDAVMAAPAGARLATGVPGMAAQAAARPSRRLIAGLVAFVLAFGAAGTWWLGSRDGWATAPGAAAPSAEAAREPGAPAAPAMNMAQIQGMVDKLAARMKNEPGNVEGWQMLGRSYAVLGQFEPAVAAYRHVLELQPKNAQVLADLADAMAAASDQRFEGEPARLVEQALAVDPDNLKALLLAGTVAFDKKDYTAAIKHWERAQNAGPPGDALVQQAGDNIAEARQLAGLPPTPAEPRAAATSPGPAISGRVELAFALAAQAAPEDTVFIFARAAEGGRMPLAILKKKVSDLPLDFTLDDSMAMSPQARLSQAQRVVVGARVSKTGQAMPQPGDLEGLSEPVAPGAQGLKLVIDHAVR